MSAQRPPAAAGVWIFGRRPKRQERGSASIVVPAGFRRYSPEPRNAGSRAETPCFNSLLSGEVGKALRLWGAGRKVNISHPPDGPKRHSTPQCNLLAKASPGCAQRAELWPGQVGRAKRPVQSLSVWVCGQTECPSLCSLCLRSEHSLPVKSSFPPQRHRGPEEGLSLFHCH